MLVIRRSTKRSPQRETQDIDQLYRALMTTRPRLYGGRQSAWRPALEVYETDADLVVIAELAGIDEASLEITVEQEFMEISGFRSAAGQTGNRRYREAGISYGPFAAQIVLPFPVEIDAAVANYETGMLRVLLPKLQPRTIRPQHDSNR